MAHQLEATEQSSNFQALGRPSISALQPKGSCWYCDNPVDNVRRFCSPVCRNDFLEEEATHPVSVAAAANLPND
jgi:hypothetical protein